MVDIIQELVLDIMLEESMFEDQEFVFVLIYIVFLLGINLYVLQIMKVLLFIDEEDVDMVLD